MDSKIRNWGVGCHLISLIGFLGIPFGNILGPLVVWLVLRKESPYIDEHGKASLNFQLSMTIYFIISFLLCFIIIGFGLLFVLAFVELFCVIKAAINAGDEKLYQYPFTFQFIK